jgi:hypothetical protein
VGNKKGDTGDLESNHRHPASLLLSAFAIHKLCLTAKPPGCTCNNYIIKEITIYIKQILAILTFAAFVSSQKCVLNQGEDKSYEDIHTVKEGKSLNLGGDSPCF